MKIFDSHLDMAANMTFCGRDLTQPVELVRQADALNPAMMKVWGRATTTLPELHAAGVGMVMGTLFCRGGSHLSRENMSRRFDCDFPDATGAHAADAAQLASYRLLERQGLIHIITDARGYNNYTQHEVKQTQAGLGLILLMECADAITEVNELAWWAEQGIRAIGLTHSGECRWAGGNGSEIGLKPGAKELLNAMVDHHIALDLSHASELTFAQALDGFEGRVLASHSNCRALVPGPRQLTDSQIRALVERDAVIGIMLCNYMLCDGWQAGVTEPEQAALRHVAEHIDHVCQLAGDSEHVGIGSDLDGGFGADDSPMEIETYRDMTRLGATLADRGFRDEDIARIFSGNWLRYWQDTFNQAESMSG